MSNAWLNIRFGPRHLIIGESWVFSVRWSRNECHRGNPKRVELHAFSPFGIHIK